MNYSGIDPENGKPINIGVEYGIITSVSRPEHDQQNLPFISHGFIDMQVNGYNGSDYSLENLEQHHIYDIIRSLALSGTTQHVPTIVTSPQPRLVKNLSTIAKAQHTSHLIDAAIIGFHIEGPYISHEDGPRRAHDLKYVRDPDFQEFL